jgi:hypothetical protein
MEVAKVLPGESLALSGVGTSVDLLSILMLDDMSEQRRGARTLLCH